MRQIAWFLTPIFSGASSDPDIIREDIVGPVENFIETNYPDKRCTSRLFYFASTLEIHDDHPRIIRTPYAEIRIDGDDNVYGTSVVWSLKMTHCREDFTSFHRLILLRSYPHSPNNHIDVLKQKYKVDEVRIMKKLRKQDILKYIFDFLTEVFVSEPVHGLK